MKPYRTFFSFALFAAVAISASTTHAYNTTDQTAAKLTNSAALFTITYEFSPLDTDFHMPIFAERNLDRLERRHVLGYEFLDSSDDRTEDGLSAGIVLSDARIENDHYIIPAGESVTMKFIALLSVTDRLDQEPYKLRVTSLPFEVGSDERQLNTSELQYYVTPSVVLNK